MKLLSFDFNNNSIRTILIDNEPWFVLKDIGKVLELSNHKQALIDMKTRLQKGGVKDEVSQTYPIKDSLNRTQEVTIVSEAGLYELAFVSRKEEAIRFRHWVARVVLPSKLLLLQ
jgi:prophage antirepressor-like protein